MDEDANKSFRRSMETLKPFLPKKKPTPIPQPARDWKTDNEEHRRYATGASPSPVLLALVLLVSACEPPPVGLMTIQGVLWRTAGCDGVDVPTDAEVQAMVDVAASCWDGYPGADPASSFVGAATELVCVPAVDLGYAGATWPDSRFIRLSAWDYDTASFVDHQRLAGLVAHELGHLVYGDATGTWVVVDTREEHHEIYGPVEEVDRCASEAWR